MDTRTATTQKYSAGASRLNRRLIELGEYAKREGITPQDVKKCSEIGIVQLRRHKGKTFVVDMPVCSYENTDQIDTEVAELLGLIQPRSRAASQQQTVPAPAGVSAAKSTLRVFSPVKNLVSRISHLASLTGLPGRNSPRSRGLDARLRSPKNIGTTPRQAPFSPKRRMEPNSISQLVQEMLRRAEQIEQEQKAVQKQPDTSITEVPQTSQRKSSPMTEELLSAIDRQLDQIETSVTPSCNRTTKQ